MTDDDRPIDTAEAWASAAGILYLLGVMFIIPSIGEPRLALSALCMLVAGGVAHLWSRRA